MRSTGGHRDRDVLLAYRRVDSVPPDYSCLVEEGQEKDDNVQIEGSGRSHAIRKFNWL